MDISVTSTSTQVEDRSWLASDFGTDEPRNITLDVSAFTAGTHYPNGYIPSGTVVGKITASGLYGPYDNAASDGTEVAAGLLFSSVKVGTADVGAAMMDMGLVISAKLPFQSGTGSIDTAGKTDLAGWFKFL